MLAAVILSGGASRRMGSPKALLPFQGASFLQHLLEITKHPRISARRIVLGLHAKEISAAIELPEAEIVLNPDWEKGQLSSLQAAIRTLPEGTDGLLLCLIDHPLIGKSLVNELIEKFYSTGMKIALPLYQGRRGHPVIFSSTLYEELLNAPLEHGARAVVWAHQNEIAEVITSDAGCVMNINDLGTMQQALDSEII